MSEEKKPTPSTNIPLLSYRKSEQLKQVELLTLCFNFKSRAQVSARPKKNSCNRGIRSSTNSKHTASTVEHGRNILRSRSKHTSITVERNLEHGPNILRSRSKHTSITVEVPRAWSKITDCTAVFQSHKENFFLISTYFFKDLKSQCFRKNFKLLFSQKNWHYPE